MQQEQEEEPVTLEQLSSYPEGSVGRAFRDFLKHHGFNANEYAAHDIIHVVTGAAPDPAGEEIAFVYDCLLRDANDMDLFSANGNNQCKFDRVKLAIANIRASLPKIALEANRRLKPYKVACEGELRDHAILAETLGEEITKRFGKHFHDMSFKELLELDNSFFDEFREEIARIRNSNRNVVDRVEIFPSADPHAMLDQLGSWVVGGLDLDAFTGAPVRGAEFGKR